MSKKKNTLKDLDEFLKQQAATLVTPARLSDKIEDAPAPIPKSSPSTKESYTLPAQLSPETSAEPQAPKEETQAPIKKNDQSVSAEKLLNDLRMLASKEGHAFRNQFYDLIIQSVEFQNQYSPEDKMLINTALYLKSGERWKEVIREYWKKKAKS